MPLDPGCSSSRPWPTSERCRARSRRGWRSCSCVIGVGGSPRSSPCRPAGRCSGHRPTVEWGLLIVGYVFFAITTSGLCLASSLGHGLRHRPLPAAREAPRDPRRALPHHRVRDHRARSPLPDPAGLRRGPEPVARPRRCGGWASSTAPTWCSSWSRCGACSGDHPRIHQWACVALVVHRDRRADHPRRGVRRRSVARSFWNGPFTPILMVASAFLSGVALLGIVFYGVDRFRLPGFERAGRLASPACAGCSGWA